MAATIYDSLEWQATREKALARDRSRCTVSRLLGGRCSPTLHVHHLVPVEEGGTHELDNLLTACAVHHPLLESLRRQVLAIRRRDRPRCPHAHRSREARRICERQLARQRDLVPA